MPLIALDILESRIKELLIMVNHLNEENSRLNAQLKPSLSQSKAAYMVLPSSHDVLNEIESLKKTVIKYKNERSQIYVRLTSALRRIDELTSKGHHG